MQVRSIFEQDNYALRHTTGHNMLDPESLITGAELAAGLNYDNSHRDWLAEWQYEMACSGEVAIPLVLVVAPRVPNDKEKKPWPL